MSCKTLTSHLFFLRQQAQDIRAFGLLVATWRYANITAESLALQITQIEEAIMRYEDL